MRSNTSADSPKGCKDAGMYYRSSNVPGVNSPLLNAGLGLDILGPPAVDCPKPCSDGIVSELGTT